MVGNPAAAEETEALVIGAGPAGLAAGACLARRGVPAIILEKETAVGSSWRRHYERLHLHTASRWSSLPLHPFPPGSARYVAREDFVAYLEAYARELDIKPRFGQGVERARFDPAAARWETRTHDGRTYRSRHLVVATSYNGEPHVPSWPGQASFRGTIVHSSAYRSGRAFAGKDVMVVGLGNSGGEIAVDLVEQGARRTCISVRNPVWVMPRDILGAPVQLTGILLRRLPLAIADRIGAAAIGLSIGDLSHLGLRRPETGPYTMVVKAGRIPLIDVGTVALLEKGALEVVPDIDRFTEDGVIFAGASGSGGGDARPLDAVVLATGYRARLDRFLDGAERVTDERGYPRWHGREVPAAPDLAPGPGLFFIGFANPPSGALREIGIEAQRIAAAIAAARRRD